MEVTRTTTESVDLVLKRNMGDEIVTIAGGQGEIAHGQVMAVNTTDGKYYIYASAGINGLDTLIGVYTGETITSAEDFNGSVTTSAVVDKGLVVGITFETDFKAKPMLQKAGTFMKTVIEGTEVNE
ncbi:hypothetical protein [uncultured Ilyobacter sp.]|uniref:hypothetical protein n=1 Tax=uncultured Ilyobacter sp. TaxID=544433 RepID=UPI0029C00D0C|nr:hypothetical protein [uncultured Ilyobacter sp.]